jgi:hypothetical protein
MSHRMRSTIVAVVMAAALGVGLSGSAVGLRSLSIEPAGAIEATGRLTIRQLAGIEIWCNVTLRGMVLPAVAKTVGAPLGGIAAAATRECAGNEFIVGPPSLIFLVGIPMLYSSFLGTLPNITGILVSLNPMKFRIDEERGPRLPPVRCLYEGPVGALFPLAGGEFERFSFLREEIRLKEGEPIAECEAKSRLVATFTVTPRQRVTLV